MPYTTIKSNFIKNKIKNRKFSKRGYIDALIKLEEHILKGTFNWGHAMLMHTIKSDHPDEYKTIQMELRPDKYKKLLEDDKKERELELKQDGIIREQERKELIECKKQWIAAGGLA